MPRLLAEAEMILEKGLEKALAKIKAGEPFEDSVRVLEVATTTAILFEEVREELT